MEIVDNYVHIDDRIVYIDQNIPGPAEGEEYDEIINSFNSQLTGYCECNNSKCNSRTCACLQKCGGANYLVSFDGNVNFVLSNKDFNIFSIIECNSLCGCSNECSNRMVQKGPLSCLIVQDCGTKGVGLFTKNRILKGTFVCEYAGEVITKYTALKRQQANLAEGNMNYIYCLNEFCNGCVTQTFVDPTYFGNIGRYMNHSCEPNCFMIPVRVDTPVPKFALFTNKDVLENEELTFDYSFSKIESLYENIHPNIGGTKRKKCLCNSLNCRQFMPYDCY